MSVYLRFIKILPEIWLNIIVLYTFHCFKTHFSDRFPNQNFVCVILPLLTLAISSVHHSPLNVAICCSTD
jgi:hypothetical protein